MLIYEPPTYKEKPTKITPQQMNQIEELMKRKGIIFKETWLTKLMGRRIEWLYQLTYDEAESILNG